jgi:hypothetical protein
MKNRKMLPLKRQRFEALVGYSRLPHAFAMSKEIEWYASKDETLLATIVLDFEDEDFVVIVLGRDADRRYRCIDTHINFKTINNARKALFKASVKLLDLGEITFNQGDERGAKLDLFNAVHAEDKLSSSFKRVRDMSGYSSAREIIQEMMHHYDDIDGNYVEQFQTTGFDARLWELYLFAYLTEEGLLIDRSHNSPDFIVTNGVQVAAIEAVVVQPTQGENIESIDAQTLTPEKIRELQKHYMPIKFGSTLYSKLKKKYWEKDHVKGKPLVFAIADFHQSQSMLWSSTALSNYLYGNYHDFHYDSSGQLIISPTKIDFHEYNGKKIQSGFFFTADTENISAVVFSSTGTISKFLRMGKIAGFGDDSVKLIYSGNKHRHDPNASLPDTFSLLIDHKYEENWGHGISVFHNPKALVALDPDIFPSATHHRMREDGQIISDMAEFHPYNGTTMMVVPRDENLTN